MDFQFKLLVCYQQIVYKHRDNASDIQTPQSQYNLYQDKPVIIDHRMKPMLVKIGMCSLNNDPLSFKKNRENIIASIQRCKDLNCTIRIGSELEVPGYSCADHFNEYDTITHSWEIIRDVLASGVTEGIVCDLGTPVIHHGNIYNCRVILYSGKVMGIRAKTILADGDNYYETRWFGFWKEKKQVDEFKLPRIIQNLTGQTSVPIGVFLIDFNDACLGYEICQEAWISDNPMIDAAMDGVQIMFNPSASNIERGKLARKIQMLKQLTQRHGGSYLYTNVKGCTGDRIYFDGGCIFTENGVVKGLSNLNTIEDIVITPVVVNVTSIRTFRLSNKSFLKSGNGVSTIPRIKIDLSVCKCEEKYTTRTEETNLINELIEEYEYPHARYEPSLFLWDFLRKSKASGFFLPLSGGLDSCAVAVIVYNMCCIVHSEITEENNQNALNDLRKIIKDENYKPTSPADICSKILFTCYMKTQFSSVQTQKRAKQIAKEINSHHRSIDFHEIFASFRGLCSETLGKDISFECDGGSKRADQALRNIQSRTRMLISYLFAETQLEIPGRDGHLLVLGCTNLDQELTGYFTKYDTSSADINPIGSFSRTRIKQFLKWNDEIHHFQFTAKVLKEKSKSELAPSGDEEESMRDEVILGLTYNEIGTLGRLRRHQKLGPVSMFEAICGSEYNVNPRKVAEKVKLFFNHYGTNRHKMSTLTPTFHYYPQGCEDARLDIRPMFYETNWDYHFELIDKKVKEMQENNVREAEEPEGQSLMLKKKSIRRLRIFNRESSKTESPEKQQ